MDAGTWAWELKLPQGGEQQDKKRSSRRAAAAQPFGARRRRDISHVRVIKLPTVWPGQTGKSAPEGFPGGGPESSGSSESGVGDGSGAARPIVISTNPAFRRASGGARKGKGRRLERGRRRLSLDDDRAPGKEEGADEPRRRRVRQSVSAVPKGFNTMVAAVYTALADPVMGGTPEARARRAARIRRVGTVAASGALGLVLIYAIFPVRTYLDQRSATQRTREELDVLTDANQRMEEQIDQLGQDDVVEGIARRDYGMVFPGEEPYAVLPPPVGTTTTTPTTTAPPNQGDD